MGTLNGAGDDAGSSAGCHSDSGLGMGCQICVQISQHSYENDNLHSTDHLLCQRLSPSRDKECKCCASDNHRGNSVNIDSVHWKEKKENTLMGVAAGRKVQCNAIPPLYLLYGMCYSNKHRFEKGDIYSKD